MQHSHEALDRPGGLGRGNLLSPLRQRDFRILWTGMTISLIGDGIFLIAIAWADGLRAVAVAVLAALVLMGALRFWELVVLVAVYGVGTAFFMPAFEAILPELLPKSELPAANALDQFVRPIAMRLIGPVVGGALVAVSTGLAFAIDAASFAACLVAVLVMPRRADHRVDVQVSNVAA